ncbi:MAG TPA: hypothetical protein VGX51_10865 [Solirubrobacteraceae bacterium]|jgi:hypothetical protein|nr:hypothetical protein [Solirubrobacteraceae bacterium]
MAPIDSTRAARRAHSRLRVRRQRRRVALAALAAIVLIAVLAAKGGSSESGGHHHNAAAHAPVVVDGGPLAPLSVGGLAALWAPQNVVGTQPGTAAAYEAASKRGGPGGYILIADRGNNRILVVSPSGQVVFLYPSSEDLRRGRRLVYNDDTFVAPGGAELIANEEDNHAIVSVRLSDHNLSVLFGHPGEQGTDSTHLNTPDDAYVLPDGSFTVADAYNCRILFIAQGRILREYGHSAVCRHEPPGYLGAVNGDTPVPGGGVLVSEINGSWIDEIGPDGRLAFAVQAPVGYPSDPQPLPGGRILLADYSNPGSIIIMDQLGHVLWRYRPTEGYDRLDHPSLAMPLPNGNIAVNDDYRHRVVVIDPRSNKIVWQYGHTDAPGTAPGYLNTPDGMDFVPYGPHGGPDYAAVVHP